MQRQKKVKFRILKCLLLQKQNKTNTLENFFDLMNLAHHALSGFLHKITLFILDMELVIFFTVLCSSVELELHMKGWEKYFCIAQN